MKKTNRLLSILLALAVVFTMALPTFAAGEGSITVENAAEGKEYTAYKIFDVVYDGSNYAYTMDPESPWLATVQAYEDVTLKLSADGTVYVATFAEDFSAADFAATLSAVNVTEGAIKMNVAGGKATATGLDLGYYLVKTSTGALCNLTTTDPNATIYDKNDFTFDKTDDDESVEVGQVVNYDVTGKVPSTTGYTTYTYKITDTMSAGLTFNEDVNVKVGNVDLPKTETKDDETVTYWDVTYNDTGFELNIYVMNLQDKVAQEILVEYTATVNSNAVTKVEKNHVELTYSNNPADSTSTDKVTDEETVFTAKIVINKHKTGEEETKLAGAQFVLINNGRDDYENDEFKGYFYKKDAVTGAVTWVKDQKDATVVTTGTDGIAEFPGLENGRYLLREIAAPAGYNMLTEDVSVTVAGKTTENAENKIVEANGSFTVTTKVPNSTGIVLPETGGIGTTIFYVLGGVLIAVAAVLLITKKRMSTEE